MSLMRHVLRQSVLMQRSLMGYKVRQRAPLVILVAVLSGLLQLSVAHPVAAHGGDGVLQISSATVGPYSLDVWTSPGMLRPGEVHVETAISQDGIPVTDCTVRVQIVPPGSTPALFRWATAAEPANRFRHEADFRLDRAGRYGVTISVLDPDGHGGEITFDVAVAPLPLWLQMALHLQLGVSGLLGIWFIRRGFFLFSRQETNNDQR